jgi:hypothetical protein
LHLITDTFSLNSIFSQRVPRRVILLFNSVASTAVIQATCSLWISLHCAFSA